MAIYGDMLSAFPELLKEYQMFTMDPKAGGGYQNRTPLFKKTGCFIKDTRSRMAISGESRITNEAGTFYCFEFKPSELMPQGVYFEEDNQIFVVATDQVFDREAGFGAYGCQLVQGTTDRQVENRQVENRTISDYV